MNVIPTPDVVDSIGETGRENEVVNGTSEWQMRNQYRAWARYMTEGAK